MTRTITLKPHRDLETRMANVRTLLEAAREEARDTADEVNMGTRPERAIRTLDEALGWYMDDYLQPAEQAAKDYEESLRAPFNPDEAA